MIKIDENWSIDTSDGYNCTLICRTEKEKPVIVDKKPTSETYMGEVIERYYFPTIESCLRKYMASALRPSKKVEDLLKRIDAVHLIIKSIRL